MIQIELCIILNVSPLNFLKFPTFTRIQLCMRVGVVYYLLNKISKYGLILIYFFNLKTDFQLHLSDIERLKMFQ